MNGITVVTGTIIVYLLGMLLIGFYFAKQNSDVGNYYLGGRQLGPFVTAMSAEASDMSSWLLMGVPGLAYLTGVADATWTAVGLALGTYLNWLIVAKRLRVYSHHVDTITIPNFFSRRFGDHKNIINLIGGLIIILFFIPYLASGFAACGKLFATLFGWDYRLSMILSALVIIIYTTSGGFLAASTTDFVQSIVMFFALFVIMVFGIRLAGGMDAVRENAARIPGYLSFTQGVVGSDTSRGFLSVFSALAWGLGYFGMPHILLRFMAIEDKEKLALSRRVATIWVAISLTVAIFIGIVGAGITAAGHMEVLEGPQSETLIVRIAMLLAQEGPLRAILAGLILSGILAATMSTADSQLLAASSAITENIMTHYMGRQMGAKKQMKVARITTLIISLVAILIALDPNNSVFEIVSFAWAGFGATFGPLMICALFWRRANKEGAMAGMVTGAIMIFLWKYAVRPLGGFWDIYELLPAFLIALLVMVLVSKATAEPEAKVQEDFDEYNRILHR